MPSKSQQKWHLHDQKGLKLFDQNLEFVASLHKSLKIQLQFLFFTKIFSIAIFHLAVAFQRYQIIVLFSYCIIALSYNISSFENFFQSLGCMAIKNHKHFNH